MSTDAPAHAAKVAELMHEMQLMTGQSILLSEGIARAVGLNGTDLEALGIIQAQERTTAGDLASATGLTTGAVTSVIDRLERAGFIRRENDPGDRRKVLLRLQPEQTAKIQQHYASLDAGMRQLASRYAANEIDLLIEFMRESTAIAAQHVATIAGTSRKRR
jgi:DNA-binding MarR family transcriptional regulator